MSLYSIGYATKDIDVFIKQLKSHQITALADVRSVPFSKRFFDYHQDALQHRLKKENIAYVYLGDELGPRSKDPTHYNLAGQVQFNRLMQSDLFLAGIERLEQGLQKGFNIALACAEKEPAVCHRSLLVGWSLLHKFEKDVIHIHHDGDIELQSKLEARLLTLTKTQPDMLMSIEEANEIAYVKQCECYAYKKKEF